MFTRKCPIARRGGLLAMKRICAALLALLLCAGAARAAENDVSVSLGGGGAYDLAGLNLSLRRGRVEGYLGAGLIGAVVPGLTGGARLYLNPDGDGFFLGANLAWHADTLHIDEPEARGGRLFWATLTPGYRLVAGSLFVQAAFGGGLVHSTTFWSGSRRPEGTTVLAPDAMLAIGVRL
jgi:hypothetical protein